MSRPAFAAIRPLLEAELDPVDIDDDGSRLFVEGLRGGRHTRLVVRQDDEGWVDLITLVEGARGGRVLPQLMVQLFELGHGVEVPVFSVNAEGAWMSLRVRWAGPVDDGGLAYGLSAFLGAMGAASGGDPRGFFFPPPSALARPPSLQELVALFTAAGHAPTAVVADHHTFFLPAPDGGHEELSVIVVPDRWSVEVGRTLLPMDTEHLDLESCEVCLSLSRQLRCARVSLAPREGVRVGVHVPLVGLDTEALAAWMEVFLRDEAFAREGLSPAEPEERLPPSPAVLRYRAVLLRRQLALHQAGLKLDDRLLATGLHAMGQGEEPPEALLEDGDMVGLLRDSAVLLHLDLPELDPRGAMLVGMALHGVALGNGSLEALWDQVEGVLS